MVLIRYTPFLALLQVKKKILLIIHPKLKDSNENEKKNEEEAIKDVEKGVELVGCYSKKKRKKGEMICEWVGKGRTDERKNGNTKMCKMITSRIKRNGSVVGIEREQVARNRGR